MQASDHALAIERATDALYATASESRQPRAVKTIVMMMVLAVVLLAMLPFLATSMDTDGVGARSGQSVTTASSPDASSATPTVYRSP